MFGSWVRRTAGGRTVCDLGVSASQVSRLSVVWLVALEDASQSGYHRSGQPAAAALFGDGDLAGGLLIADTPVSARELVMQRGT